MKTILICCLLFAPLSLANKGREHLIDKQASATAEMKGSQIPARMLCCPGLSEQEQDRIAQKTAQRWRGYAELGLFHRLLKELEAESRKEDPAREPELIRTLLTHWEAIMRQRRWCDVYIHWDGDGAYGYKRYRTKDLPPEMVQQLHAYRDKREKAGEAERNQYIALKSRIDTYIENAPNAEKIDLIIRLIHREEYPRAITLLAQLRREHPDYCPRPFTELAAALNSPKRLKILLLCTGLPLGVIRETHVVE